jgi:hypothetical protein
MNKFTDSSSNNEYDDYYNVNKLKICEYFYDVLVTREEKNKKIQKKRTKLKY